MPEIKNTFLKSKMNKDLDARLLPNGEYREAMNVSISKSEGQGVGSLENIKGNELKIAISNTQTVDNCDIIGRHTDVSRDRVFLFLTNYSDGSSDQLSSFNLSTSPAGWGNIEVNCFIVMLQHNESVVTSTLLVSGNFLNFSKTHPIFGINIIEDLLFWTDNRNQPRRINVDKAISDSTYYDSEDKISLLKYYPYNPIRLYDNDGTVSHTKTTMKNVTQQWLPSTNAPVIAFPGGTTFNTPPTLSWPNDPDNPSTTNSGNYFVCYAYYDHRDVATANPWDSNKFSDGIVREFLPSKSITGTNTNDGLDTRCSHTTYKVASNQLVRCLDTRSTTTGQTYELRQDNDCRLIAAVIEEATIRTNFIMPTTPVNTVGLLWKFTIWAPQVSGAVNPDLTTLINIIGTKNSSFGSAAVNNHNNDPGIPKAKLFFHYPNPDYEVQTQVDEQFLKQKFVRFAYRFKYEDDEYSLISPFTQNVFIPEQFGHFMEEDESLTKKSKDVHFMENYINEVLFYIDLPYSANQLKAKLDIKEIEILFKDSDEVNIKYIDSIDVDSITSNDTFVTYQYKSSKPIKVIPESENTRVSDKAPVRALAQEAVGNRIVFGNFIDKLKAPDTLLYSSFVSSKLTYPYSSNDVNTFAQREYPLHNLKNNRTYQVGFVLYDRYGRSSDVITSTFDRIKVTSDAEPGSTVYAPYKKESGWNAMQFFGDSLRIRLYDYIPSSISNDPSYKGVYSSTNPLGWYSYKIVVKQQEQEYYNVYVPGIQTRTGYERGWNPQMIDNLSWVFNSDNTAVTTTATTFVDSSTGVISTPGILDLFDFDYKGVTPRYQIEISGDNINKIPKSLINVGPVDKEFAGSDVGLFVRVAPQHWNRSFQHFITGDYPTPDKVESIREFNTFNIEPNETIRITPYITQTPAVAKYNFDNAPLVDFYNGGNILNKQSSLLIGSVSSKNCDADNVPGPPMSAYERNSRWVNLGVLETTPVKSELNLFWETATTGLISDLNSALTAAGGPDIPNQLLDAASPFNAKDLDIYEAPVGLWDTGGAGTIITAIQLAVSPDPITPIAEQVDLVHAGGTGGIIPGFSSTNPAFPGTVLNISDTKLNSSSTTPLKASLTSFGSVSGLEKYELKNTGNYDFLAGQNFQIDFSANLHTTSYSFSESTTIKSLDPHFWYIYGVASPTPQWYATRNVNSSGITPFLFNTHANNYEPIAADMDSDSQIPVVGGQYNSDNKVLISDGNVYGIQKRSLRDIMDQRPSTTPSTLAKVGSTFINSGCYRNVGTVNIQIISSRWYNPNLISPGNGGWEASSNLWEVKEVTVAGVVEQYIRTKSVNTWNTQYTNAPSSTTQPNHEITFRAYDGANAGSTYIVQIFLFSTG